MSTSIEKLLHIKKIPSQAELGLFEHTKKYMKWVYWIPGLRMIAVGNTLAMYTSDENSDIDLFVVTEPKRMWFVRIIMTGIFHFLGVRRHREKVAGRFCLSFFCTTDALDFEKIAIENDIYLAAWVTYLKPIVDIGEMYGEFIRRNSLWVEKIDALELEVPADATTYYSIKKPLHTERFSLIWDALDSFFKFIFLPRTQTKYHSDGRPWGIIINDTMLKFHKNDTRMEVREEWLKN